MQPDTRVTLLNHFERLALKFLKHLIFTDLKLDLEVHCDPNFGTVKFFIAYTRQWSLFAISEIPETQKFHGQFGENRSIVQGKY